MIAKTHSATVLGVDAHCIDVEVDLSLGLSQFTIVGLPDGTIRESRDRILAALANSGFSLPIRKIVVNLAPAPLRKIGSGFDLPIAIALLGAAGLLPAETLAEYMMVGELSLDGQIKPVTGVLPMTIAAKAKGLRGLVLPKENEAEAAIVSNMQRVPVARLEELVGYFQGSVEIEQGRFDPKEWFQSHREDYEDLQEVKGQEQVKRALEIAAAGGHNLLMAGPPGSGKTMLARRMGSLLPALSFEEALECTKIHSITGLLHSDTPMLTERPFRSPHHTISSAGLVGGGTVPTPGEISLAHNGVLFLDELPEFSRNILELLRQPIEDRKLTIARAVMSLEFPCDFMLLAAMNPCPCGYAGSSVGEGKYRKECHCTPKQIERYRTRISGPLLDRIDLHVQVPAVDYAQLADTRRGESTATVRQRVEQARGVQRVRFRETPIRSNAHISSKFLEQYATPDAASRSLLENAITRMGLSARAYDRILKVSRTIADLADSENIQSAHVAEAIQYRVLDRPATT